MVTCMWGRVFVSAGMHGYMHVGKGVRVCREDNNIPLSVGWIRRMDIAYSLMRRIYSCSAYLAHI